MSWDVRKWYLHCNIWQDDKGLIIFGYETPYFTLHENQFQVNGRPVSERLL